MAAKQPNVVLIVNDQDAYYRHGWDTELKPARPNFERVAQDGILFERAYTACPLCTPARRSMLTGLLPHNHGHITLDPKENTEGIDHSILFSQLAEQGYQLSFFGKWHAGPDTAQDYGCEGFSLPGYGNPYISPEYKAYCEQRGLEEASFNLEHVFLEKISPDQPQIGPGYQCKAQHAHTHVTGTMETPPDTHEAQFLANLACDKLRELAKQDDKSPFFLRVDFWGPHAPYLASPEYVDMYPPEQIPEYGNFGDDLSNKPLVYLKEWNHPISRDNRLILPNPLPWSEWQRIMRYVYAQITQVDAAGGLILDTLDELGMAENTLVIWTADHGDAICSHGGHFGKESFLNEEVLRIPMALRWPECIDRGQTSQHLVSNMDCPVTVLNAAGTSVGSPVDGRNLLDLINDGQLHPGNGNWQDDLMCETHGHHWEPVTGRAIVTQRYRFVVYQYHGQPDYVDEVDTSTSMEELYDLQEDPYQLNNLATDGRFQNVIAEHRRRLKRWQEQTGDPVHFDQS